MSLIAEAFADWRICRAEYDQVLYSQYQRAEDATNGRLVNAEGRARGIDPLSLFMGTNARAMRWASEELIEHWRSHPRTTFASFERQWQRAREAEFYAS
jgi:hypothetical protein